MRIYSLNTGFFKLDGGAMFGVVPKSMWSKLNPPDEKNLCTWALRTLLIQTPNGRNIIVDTGIGNKQDARFQSHFEPFEQQNYDTLLAQHGLTRMDISDVFLTHLHFDHVGGALFKNQAGETEITFPKATYWSNKRHFDWAMKPNPRERASFLKENFLPLYEQGRMKFVNERQNTRFEKGINLRFFHGHTDAMMGLTIKMGDGREICYYADALPSQWHVGMPYVMAYDVRPLQVLKEKKIMLERAYDREQLLLLEHDPKAQALRLGKDEKRGRIIAAEANSIEALR